MGTWQTFDIDIDSAERGSRKAVLETFFAAGGGMIDSSPMYGRAEAVIGQLMEELRSQATEEQDAPNLFSTTKIWTPLTSYGPEQLMQSHKLWKEEVLDLVKVHNLLRWESHLERLRQAKSEGTVRYIGVTTSHGRRHDALERLMKTEAMDAVQFTYNIFDRQAEERLLPIAKEQGLTVIINRPFKAGQLFNRVAGKNLPEWAVSELDCQSWAEYFLKFIISHPAIDCAIPATTRPEHMAENMRAATGPKPSASMRDRMAKHFGSI
jgi:diketogulonate reductase-like aldo/keto reductase